MLLRSFNNVIFLVFLPRNNLNKLCWVYFFPPCKTLTKLTENYLCVLFYCGQEKTQKVENQESRHLRKWVNGKMSHTRKKFSFTFPLNQWESLEKALHTIWKPGKNQFQVTEGERTKELGRFLIFRALKIFYDAKLIVKIYSSILI